MCRKEQQCSLVIEDSIVFDFSGVRQVIQDSVQQRLDTLVFQSCAHQYWGEETLHCGPTDGSLKERRSKMKQEWG